MQPAVILRAADERVCAELHCMNQSRKHGIQDFILQLFAKEKRDFIKFRKWSYYGLVKVKENFVENNLKKNLKEAQKSLSNNKTNDYKLYEIIENLQIIVKY